MAVYHIDSLVGHDSAACINGKWVPARPVNYKYEGWPTLLRHAWGVLIGKYDCVKWEGQ